jgi:processive 1,2-diacylglycerol beta-glucosyltransferase
MPRHILVLSVSAGAGHVRAPQAVCAAARGAHPAVRATHLDLLTLVSRTSASCTASSTSSWWRNCRSSGPSCTRRRPPSRDSLLGKLKRAVESLNTRKLDAEIARLAAGCHPLHAFPARRAAVAATCAAASELPPLWVQVTDFDVHALWVHPHVDRYCVASDEVAYPALDPRHRAGKISVTGIPVMPQFAEPLERRPAPRSSAGPRKSSPSS